MRHRRPARSARSREASYAIRLSVTVAEISTVIRGIPSEVRLGSRDALPRPCVINADNLVTIPRSILETKIASLSAARTEQLDAALRFALGLA